MKEIKDEFSVNVDYRETIPYTDHACFRFEIIVHGLEVIVDILIYQKRVF